MKFSVATAGVCVLSLWCVFYHPTLNHQNNTILSYIYYTLIFLITFLESMQIIPNKIYHSSFRSINDETCISGIIIIPLLSSTISHRLHIQYLSFSILSLIIYLSMIFNHKNTSYLKIFAIIICLSFGQKQLFSTKIQQTNNSSMIIFLMNCIPLQMIISLIIFQCIFNYIIKYLIKVFTFSDTIIVACMLYFCIESCFIFTFFPLLPINICHHENRLSLNEYFIVSILMITFAIAFSIILMFVDSHARMECRNMKNEENEMKKKFWMLQSLIVIVCSSLFLVFWINFVLDQRGKYFNECESSVIYFSDIFSLVKNVILDHCWILAYWMLLLIIGFISTPIPSSFSSSTKIIMRKYFHGWCLILFIPIVIYDAAYLSFAFSIALCFFIVVEGIRVSNFLCLRSLIEQYCRPFLDVRDGGMLVLTHIWLLIGCAIPVWYSMTLSSVGERIQLIYSVSGIIILGVGDACAAIFGSKYGRIRWPYSSKTLEGTAAGILSTMMIFCIILYFFNGRMKESELWLYLRLFFVVCVTFFFEAITKQIDNLYLPLFSCLFIDIMVNPAI